VSDPCEKYQVEHAPIITN